MIDSKNVVFETQFCFKTFLIEWKIHVPFLKYSVFYISDHSINLESCDIMIGVGKLLVLVYFWINLLNLGQLTHGKYF